MSSHILQLYPCKYCISYVLRILPFWRRIKFHSYSLFFFFTKKALFLIPRIKESWTIQMCTKTVFSENAQHCNMTFVVSVNIPYRKFMFVDDKRLTNFSLSQNYGGYLLMGKQCDRVSVIPSKHLSCKPLLTPFNNIFNMHWGRKLFLAYVE